MRTFAGIRRGVAVIVALLVCLSGCANVPSGGRVVSGRPAERAEPIAEPYVRVVPVRPRHNWAPNEIVRGFLIASSAFNDDHEVAREYLTPAANADWRPGPRPRVIVLDGEPSVSASREVAGETLVDVTAAQLGRIGSDGQYTAQPGTTYTTTFGLQRDPSGQWRISRLPADLLGGLLLSQSDVDRVFRVLNLYFFDPDGNVLVPNAVFLPLVNRQDLARQLVAALLAGPTSWLESAVRSYFPPGTRLKGNGVDIADGIATVNLSAEAYRGDHERMSAQLAWTLQRLPEVRRIKLQIDGDAVEPGGVGPVQAPEDWEEYNSDTSRGGTEEIIYLRGPDGRPHRLHDGSTTPAGTTGQDDLHRPALSPDERMRIAGLDSDGDTVLSGDLTGGEEIRPVMRAEEPDGRFTPPSWDPRGWLWSVESYPDGSSLWLRPKGRQPLKVQQWDLAGHEVVALRVARDGVRVAAIVKIDGRRQLRLGRIVRNSGGVVNVGGFLPIGPELVDVTDLVWSDSTSLAVLGKTKHTATQVTPYRVPVSGGDIVPVGTASQGEAESITAAPGSRIVIGAEINGEDNICRQSNQSDWRFDEWKCEPLGSDPTYWS